MKNIKVKFVVAISLLFFFATVVTSPCNGENKEKDFIYPQIRLGVCKISGKIIQPGVKPIKVPIKVRIAPLYSITGKTEIKEIKTDSVGRFTIDLNTETNPSICFISSGVDGNDTGLFVELSQEKDNMLDIYYDKDSLLNNVQNSSKNQLTTNDMIYGMKAMDDLLDYHPVGVIHLKVEQPQIAFPKFYEKMAKWKERLYKNKIISDKMKSYIFNECFAEEYVEGILHYKIEVKKKYLNSNQTDSASTFMKQNQKYYSIKSDLDLNDAKMLYSYLLPYLQKALLEDSILNISSIKDTPIALWQNEVKNKISGLVGFNQGRYYDLLTAYAYANQIDNQTECLTNKQIDNIKSFFKNHNPGIINILLSDNNRLISQLAKGSDCHICTIPKVADNKQLIDAIVSRYKGKTVLVDLWETWCGPCMSGLLQMENIKEKLKKEGVVFVYIACSSSPKKTWEERIKRIGGEQYYLSDKEKDAIMDGFGFEGIPSYVIYGKEGHLKNKFTGFPGNDNMQSLIEDALK
jgi:thiol-disulfide isomerase/thioredoxin